MSKFTMRKINLLMCVSALTFSCKFVDGLNSGGPLPRGEEIAKEAHELIDTVFKKPLNGAEDGVVSPVVDLGSKAIDDITKGAVGNAVAGISGEAGDIVSGIAEGAGSVAVGLLDTVGGTVGGDVVDIAQKVGSSVIGGIADVADATLNLLQDTTSDISGNSSQDTTSTASPIGDIVAGIAEGAGSVAVGLLDTVGGDIIDIAQKVGSSVIGGIAGVADATLNLLQDTTSDIFGNSSQDTTSTAIPTVVIEPSKETASKSVVGGSFKSGQKEFYGHSDNPLNRFFSWLKDDEEKWNALIDVMSKFANANIVKNRVNAQKELPSFYFAYTDIFSYGDEGKYLVAIDNDVDSVVTNGIYFNSFLDDYNNKNPNDFSYTGLRLAVRECYYAGQKFGVKYDKIYDYLIFFFSGNSFKSSLIRNSVKK
ncbi:hypothetical protein [Borrelia persica]|uniref:hypothetical protein n=1 Tax=Borrelia persica TaxID=44448 RepID=UPI0004638DB1|nr:hypothetical protein [Borrelia persica]